MENNFFELLQVKKQQNELTELYSVNEKTKQFGLALSKEEAKELIEYRNESLKKYERVEFGKGILDKLIFAFCDSQYLHQGNYLTTMEQLQDIFYDFKNQAQDKISDDELLNFMKEQFETVCFGDVEYLATTCLERFGKAIRSGYGDFKKSDGLGEYEQFDEEQRWDKDLYMDVVKELFW